MADKKQIKKRKSSTGNIPGRKVDDPKLVAALVAASVYGANYASSQCGVSVRTISRYQMLIRNGSRPELAELVHQAVSAQGLIERTQLEKVLSVALDRLEQLLPSANIDKTLNAVEKLGELKIAGDAINVGSRSNSGSNKQNPSVNIYQGPVLQQAADQQSSGNQLDD